jgi:hypothetical protein
MRKQVLPIGQTHFWAAILTLREPAGPPEQSREQERSRNKSVNMSALAGFRDNSSRQTGGKIPGYNMFMTGG